MKKALIFSLLTALFLGFSFDVDAQYRGKKKKKKKSSAKSEYFENSGDFFSRLWYGADVSLGFRGTNIGNFVVAGISPAVGYKITDNFSVGPKVGILYNGGRVSNGTEEFRLNITDYSVGAFTRFKFFQNYFLHGEVENIWQSFIPANPSLWVTDSNGRIETTRDASFHYYLGAGYTTGGDLALNFYGLWDFSEEFNSVNLPIVIRTGISYRF